MKRLKKVDMITVCSSKQTEGGKTTRDKVSKRGEMSKFAQNAQTETATVLTKIQLLKSLKNVTNLHGWRVESVWIKNSEIRTAQGSCLC